MGDRRAARANRLLDPTWHKLQAAVDRLYREVEPGAHVAGVSISVVTSDGESIGYGIFPDDDPTRVERYIAPDPSVVQAALESVTINATPDEP